VLEIVIIRLFERACSSSKDTGMKST